MALRPASHGGHGGGSESRPPGSRATWHRALAASSCQWQGRRRGGLPAYNPSLSHARCRWRRDRGAAAPARAGPLARHHQPFKFKFHCDVTVARSGRGWGNLGPGGGAARGGYRGSAPAGGDSSLGEPEPQAEVGGRVLGSNGGGAAAPWPTEHEVTSEVAGVQRGTKSDGGSD